MAGDHDFPEVAIIFPEDYEGGPPDRELGFVTQRYGPRVVIAGVTPAHRARLAELDGVVVVEDVSTLDAGLRGSLDELGEMGIAAFQARSSAEYAARKRSRPGEGEPWNTPGRTPPDPPPGTAEFLTSTVQSPGTPTSSCLRGSVAVGLVIVMGPAENGLGFSDSERSHVVAEAQNGLAWLGSRNQLQSINWVYHTAFVSISVPPSAGMPEASWRDPAMAQLGYPPGMEGVRQYVEALRTRSQTDWAFCAFITKYPLYHFAYANLGGPRFVIHFENDDWRPENLDRLIAHETGHIFNAPDEYSPCSCDARFGIYQVPNRNCEACGGVPCIMKRNTWEMCAWTPRHLGTPQWNIAGNATVSRPYVVNGVVYFQGTDNKLWRVNTDGTNQQHIGNHATASSPFMADGVVYFRGTNNRLWRVNIDGTNTQHIGNHATASSPFVADGVVYFQGTDNKLWRVNIDGTNTQHIGNHATASSPFVADGYVYFQGTDNKLWRVSIDGTITQHIGNHTTASSPFWANGVVYFQGTGDHGLWSVNSNGTNTQPVGHNRTASSPFVSDRAVYFRGTDDALWMINI